MGSLLRQGLYGCALITLAASSAVQAANITFFQFSGDPSTFLGPNPPEIVYTPAGGLTTGPGATGDGSFFAPGLFGLITGGLPGIPDSPPGIGFGSTHNFLSDLSLSLTGFATSGAASSTPTTISQGLTSGTFSVYYHNPSDGASHANDLVILSGSTTSALITLKDLGVFGSAGSVLSGTVQYTGGILLSEFSTAGLGTTGTFSVALTGITNYGIGDDNHLLAFSADGVGTFDAIPATGRGNPLVPTPAALWSGLGLLGLLGASRFKTNRSDRT